MKKKRYYTLYISIFLLSSAFGQTSRASLYKITDTLYNDTVSISTAYYKKLQETKEFNSYEKMVEYYKDSLFQDTVIKHIRKFPLEFTSDHGGTFDYYYGSMSKGIYKRNYDYGSSAYDGSYNEDFYYKDGKVVALIMVDYISYDPKFKDEIRIRFFQFSVKSVFELKLDSNIVIPKCVIK